MDEPTARQFTQAASDSEALLAKSLIISRMVSLRTVGIQLVRLADEMIRDELNDGWDVDVELTCQTLAASSCAHVAQNPRPLDELVQGLARIAGPIVETLAWQDREDAEYQSCEPREVKPDLARLLTTKIRPGSR